MGAVVSSGRGEICSLPLIPSPVLSLLLQNSPLPVGSDLALPLTFSSSGPPVLPTGHGTESGGSGLFALCTLDGTLKLMEEMEEADKLLWSVQVDHQLFALEKLDVTGNGHEEVVACAWDGQTYIIDHNRTVVRFQVDENIRAFCAGLYACKEGRNSPCLVYVTFNQKIYVYWEVQLERMESTNLLKLLETKPEYHSLLQELGVDPDDLPVTRALLHQTLYHPDQPPQCAPSSLQDPT
ncbi:hypothetical protein H8958_008256 [Nasalis larvatus]